ncbi:aromatic ring-hydroxylating dioxygenase subunit alpha [Pusillimonas minor]|uniref:Aromatic ring-hydroxylating dioxygenase subunit alpha n=1 Tax=Pusillimonas minor TaxID=2697024 RepID=A0A842HP80_9BURK|nr:aromatic ring-hydroxylating dioxygenase subunit alpha [Pusillimonas minor]MBC2769090.1 aromatic ring-hydroxylating dioxygenase subunit alpha [Pusillimonas minor]
MFIRNIWYIAGWAKDIGATPVARRICNEPIVLFRTLQGQVGALIDRCCHRGVPLSLGSVVEAGIECGYHGLVMDCSGTCVHIPGQKNIPASTKVRSYPVVEKDELIWIWMGDPELADPSQILDYPVHNDYKNWPHKHGFYRIKGNYQLLVDNLMDLTHLGYVHKTTIGGDPNTHVTAHMETRETPRGVKVVRHMPDCLPPPTYRKGVPFAGHVDRWQEFEFVPPATVLQWSGAADTGKGALTDENQREGGFSLRVFHGVTPETESTCLYFWSTANGYRQDDPQATEDLYNDVSTAFREDQVMIEAQQRMLEETGEADLVSIIHDRGRIQMRRIVERLIEQENPKENTAVSAERKMAAVSG